MLSTVFHWTQRASIFGLSSDLDGCRTFCSVKYLKHFGSGKIFFLELRDMCPRPSSKVCGGPGSGRAGLKMLRSTGIGPPAGEKRSGAKGGRRPMTNLAGSVQLASAGRRVPGGGAGGSRPRRRAPPQGRRGKQRRRRVGESKS